VLTPVEPSPILDDVMATRREVFFYGDLNCPYCYTKNERLVRAGLDREVTWRGVNHLPDLPSPWSEPAPYRDKLTEHVAKIRNDLATEVPLEQPPFLPNVSLATMTIAEVALKDRGGANSLRTWLYRALWRDGRDISLPEVIAEGCRALDLGEVTPSREAKRQTRIWSSTWRNGPFDRRIPVLATPNDDRLLGLFDEDRIAAFIHEHSDHGAHGSGVCRPTDR
jgi:2-hydroxychromene-2-carboxylate isomerase